MKTSKYKKMMQKYSSHKYDQEIRSLIASQQESNLLLAIHLALANGISLDYLADCLYDEASLKIINCHGQAPDTIYDLKFNLVFDHKKYGLSFSVEGIPIASKEFFDDFEELLRMGGEYYSLKTRGLVPAIELQQKTDVLTREEIRAVICQLLEQYLNNQ